MTADNTTFLKTATEWNSLIYKGLHIQTYHWISKNDAPVVLLAHGWESNSSRWKAQIELLQKAHISVIAIDAPKHGRTDGAYFGAILYGEMMNEVVKKYQPTAIVGHSIGGFAAVYCLATFPYPSVSKLILLATPSNLREIFDLFHNILKTNARVRRGYYTEFAKRAGGDVDNFTAKNMCKTLTVNALIIHDKQDDVARVADARDIHGALKGSELVITEGYGHRLQNAVVYQKIVDFLKKAE